MAFKYRARNADQWDKQANQTGNNFEGVLKEGFKVYQMKKGVNLIRILPPTWDNPDHYGISIHTHYGVGPTKAAVICLQNTKGQRCPLCEARNRFLKLGDEEEAKQLRASKRTICWVLDRKDEDAGPQLLNMGFTLDKEICQQAKDESTGEILALDHPTEGYDLQFTKEGEQLQTQYGGVKLARRPSDVDESALDYVTDHPVPDCLRWRSYEELKKLYEGNTGDEDEASNVTTLRRSGGGGGGGVLTNDRQGEQVIRRRVAAPEPEEEGNEDARDAINREVPFDGGKPISRGDEDPPGRSTADRLRERYKRGE